VPTSFTRYVAEVERRASPNERAFLEAFRAEWRRRCEQAGRPQPPEVPGKWV